MIPCPFCGSAKRLEVTKYRFFAVRCEGCLIDGPTAESRKEAVLNWNTRRYAQINEPREKEELRG